MSSKSPVALIDPGEGRTDDVSGQTVGGVLNAAGGPEKLRDELTRQRQVSNGFQSFLNPQAYVISI